MTWNAARAASKRALPKPRKDHGLVVAAGVAGVLEPEGLRNLVATRRERACGACGYIICDPVFHNMLPDGWAVSGATHCTHLETGAAVWCRGRNNWGYAYRARAGGHMDGTTQSRSHAMACATWPYVNGMLPRTPGPEDYWLRQQLYELRAEHAKRQEIIALYGVWALSGNPGVDCGAAPLPKAFVGVAMTQRGGAGGGAGGGNAAISGGNTINVSVVASTDPNAWRRLHPTCCLTCGRLHAECKCH